MSVRNAKLSSRQETIAYLVWAEGQQSGWGLTSSQMHAALPPMVPPLTLLEMNRVIGLKGWTDRMVSLPDLASQAVRVDPRVMGASEVREALEAYRPVRSDDD